MNTLAKSLAHEIPSQETAFFRSFLNFLLLLPILLYKKRGLLGVNKKMLFVRAVLGYAGLFLAFYSYSLGLLAESTILIKTSIIFTALWSSIFLKERFNLKVFLLSLLGFFGAYLIIKPDPDHFISIAGLAALCSGFVIGLITITIRKLQETDDSLSIVFAFALWGSVFGAILSAPSFVIPNYSQSLVLLGIGTSGAIAQFLFTESFRFGPAASVQPFMYTEILFAIIIGNFFFGERIDYMTFIGAALIMLSGIGIIRSSR